MSAKQQPKIDSWVLITSHHGILVSEAKQLGVDPSIAVGFYYLDMDTGPTVQIETFAARDEGDMLRATKGPKDRRSRLIIRAPKQTGITLMALASEQRKNLGLPEEPDWIEIYRPLEVGRLRKLSILDPIRHHEYVDSIQFTIPAQQAQQHLEIVWGHVLQQLSDDQFICRLLNQPHQDFGLRNGDRVMVQVVAGERRSEATYMHKLNPNA